MLTTMTKLSAGFAAILCGTSNLFSGQQRSHTLRCPQIVVLFAVLFVDSTNRHTLKNAEDSTYSSYSGFDPILTTMTKRWAGFPATLCRTSIQFQDQPRSRILRFLRTVVLFFVVIVDCEEWFCILLGSLAGARRGIVCILYSLEQSRVGD